MNIVLPENILKLMSPEERAALGPAGKTKAEAEAAFIAKNEAQLQALIRTMLQRNGVYVISQRTDKRSNVAIGCPDFLFSVDGVAVAWEIKMPGKNPRPDQVETMKEMTANGWNCQVIKSYDEALAAYRALRGNPSGRGE